MIFDVCISYLSDSKIIELDGGKFDRKPLYLIVKTHGFPVDFPLNQSIDKRMSLLQEPSLCFTLEGPGNDIFGPTYD